MESPSQPRPIVTVADAVGLIVGIVVGAGIFRMPSLVAANAGSEWVVLLAWGLGGVVSLIGALVYAELATTFPHAGGDYHYLTRAFGGRVGFLFAWARISVIQTGSIAFLAFVFGDYASRIAPVGPFSPAIYAAALIVALTALNVKGVREGTRVQNVLTIVEVAGVLCVVVAGLALVAPAAVPAPADADAAAPATSFGLMMVFVLLTYGGWNEAAYVSAELRDVRRNMLRALVFSITVITVIYVLANLAYLRALGLAGMAAADQIAADVLQRAFGARGAAIISLLVAVSALTSANATVFTGARSSYAFGRDFQAFRALGHWHARTGTPVNALIVQGAVALALVVFGAVSRGGFETVVEYTAPVFWAFFLLTGIALFVLRRTHPHVPRPFSVPLYPVTPIVFCLSSAYLLYSSLAYTGAGALVGVAVLAVGVVLLLVLYPKAERSRT